ncbi:ABC transporter permease [Flavobacteriales bacterium]|nr:ABC transporter permease [Flavobacteriales bacterium]
MEGKKTPTMNSLSQIAWSKFKKDFLGVSALCAIALAVLVSIFGYLVFPDSSPYANQMHLELSKQHPGFQVDMILLPKEEVVAVSFFNKMIYGQENPFKEIPISQSRLVGGKLYYYAFGTDYEQLLERSDYSIISRTYRLGTDSFGRDLLSRILCGTRVSLSVGFIAVLISLIIGITLGAMAAYFRGKVDAIIMWLVNVVWSIPTLLMVIAISLALGKGFWQVFVAVGLTMWVEVARVVRGEVLSLREKEYVEAAQSLGFGHFRIIFKHILPNVMGAVIVISAANFASAILIESGLSFLGIGAQPPMPSWGTMIKDHYAFIVMGKPYLAIFPGLAIMYLVLSFVLVGNALRDALDVRY